MGGVVDEEKVICYFRTKDQLFQSNPVPIGLSMQNKKYTFPFQQQHWENPTKIELEDIKPSPSEVSHTLLSRGDVFHWWLLATAYYGLWMSKAFWLIFIFLNIYIDRDMKSGSTLTNISLEFVCFPKVKDDLGVWEVRELFKLIWLLNLLHVHFLFIRVDAGCHKTWIFYLGSEKLNLGNQWISDKAVSSLYLETGLGSIP